MLNTNDILETVRMIETEHLDIRTVTMGISLLRCAGGDPAGLADRIYDTVTTRAEHLVQVSEELEREYGIPIVNKRVSVTPISLVGAGQSAEGFLRIARALDHAADTLGIHFIGGYTALVPKGATESECILLDTIPEALSSTERVCASVNAATTKAGLNMDVVARMGHIIRRTAELTQDRQCIGAAKLVVFANAPEDNPFMAGAFHGVGEGDCVINIGVSGPGVVCAAIEKCPDAPFEELFEVIKKTAFKITRMGQLIAGEASKRLGVPFGIVDLSLAPTPAVGDSVARILEAMGVGCCGGCGTTAALALLNDAVKKGGVMASSRVGGLSGAFIPVSEDEGMIDAAKSGCLTIEKLEAMTAVCSVGLDMIAIPGDTSAAVISALIADELSIGVANTKTTAVRVIPAIGKKEGESLSFGGLLGDAPIMRINQTDPVRFIARGGLIPAPIHSLKN